MATTLACELTFPNRQQHSSSFLSFLTPESLYKQDTITALLFSLCCEQKCEHCNSAIIMLNQEACESLSPLPNTIPLSLLHTLASLRCCYACGISNSVFGAPQPPLKRNSPLTASPSCSVPAADNSASDSKPASAATSPFQPHEIDEKLMSAFLTRMLAALDERGLNKRSYEIMPRKKVHAAAANTL